MLAVLGKVRNYLGEQEISNSPEQRLPLNPSTKCQLVIDMTNSGVLYCEQIQVVKYLVMH